MATRVISATVRSLARSASWSYPRLCARLWLLLCVGATLFCVPALAAPCSNAISAEAFGVSVLDLSPHEIDALRQFYLARGNECAWSEDQVAALGAVLVHAPDQGLDITRYNWDAVATLDADPEAETTAARDFVATATALRYAHDMVMGRIDLAMVDSDVDVPRPPDDLAIGLAGALAQRTLAPWLASLIPADPAYGRLLQALRAYRERADRGGQPPILAGKTIKWGALDPRVAALKERLRALGDLRVESVGPNWDAPTKSALEAFQRRHGLASDGRMGDATLAALNQSDQEQEQQIVVNLERWHYLGHVLPPTRIEVNVAGETAQLFDDGHVVLAMRTIVGASRHPTPILISPAVEGIVLNPPWVVPASIIKNEIEPKLARDPDYLARSDMQWVNGQLVQSPGPTNSLGRIKFDFSNPFSVYMHDTPARALFAKDDRARSHGCVRLEKPLDLAVELLKRDAHWPRQRLIEAIGNGTTTRIDFAGGPPVVFAYWTAFVDEDGTVEFRDDLYGRDARLNAALAAQTNTIPAS
jgi:L,D-transpeptidase YcbB